MGETLVEVFRVDRDVGQIQHREKCIELPVQSVIALVKFHLNQQKESPFTVENVIGKEEIGFNLRR